MQWHRHLLTPGVICAFPEEHCTELQPKEWLSPSQPFPELPFSMTTVLQWDGVTHFASRNANATEHQQSAGECDTWTSGQLPLSVPVSFSTGWKPSGNSEVYLLGLLLLFGPYFPWPSGASWERLWEGQRLLHWLQEKLTEIHTFVTNIHTREFWKHIWSVNILSPLMSGEMMDRTSCWE